MWLFSLSHALEYALIQTSAILHSGWTRYFAVVTAPGNRHHLTVGLLKALSCVVTACMPLLGPSGAGLLQEHWTFLVAGAAIGVSQGVLEALDRNNDALPGTHFSARFHSHGHSGRGHENENSGDGHAPDEPRQVRPRKASEVAEASEAHEAQGGGGAQTTSH